jgi:hypothetical protein
MSEIRKGNNEYVYLDLYGQGADGVPTVTCTNSDGVVTNLSVSSDEAPADAVARYFVVLGLAQTQQETELEVEWTFSVGGEPVVRTDYFVVVTPILSVTEVKDIYPDATDKEARAVEASVRHIIEAYTGQKFGYATKTLTVEGHGETALRLPERLVELTGISTLTSVLNPSAGIIVSDGWYLKKSWANVTSTIENDSEYWGDAADATIDDGIYSDPDGDGVGPFVGPLGFRPGGVINAPGTSGGATPWSNDYPFKITGKWGYKTVPQNVKEAARLLVNDYACMEIAYRDRYLKRFEAADWKMEFYAQAHAGTGNARADQLLSEYVILDWAVV